MADFYRLFLGLFASVSLAPGDSLFIDGLGGAFHLWFGSFIGIQTMKTRVVFNKVIGSSRRGSVMNAISMCERSSQYVCSPR
jgi:hypothetical protein